MKQLFPTLIFMLFGFNIHAQTNSLTPEPFLVPEPRFVMMENQTLQINQGEPVNILLPVKAGGTARHAAKMLQKDIDKRFGKKAGILSVAKEEGGLAIVFKLSAIIENIPKNTVNGFHISMDADKKQIELTATDPNGLIYGQNILFQLMQKEGEGIRIPACEIYDWPAIKLRGRNYSQYEHFAEPGILDLHLRAGMNYIDLRKGGFGTTDLNDMDPGTAKTVVDEAHLRGMFVWGTVGVQLENDSEAEVQRVLNMFRTKYYDYEVDGLWASYDDPGSGVSPTKFLKAFVELCDSIGLDDEEIALLPHDPGYKQPGHEFNLNIIEEVPRTKAFCWVFTANPDYKMLQRCRDIGLEKKPMYWWNWPRTEAYFARAKSYDKSDTISIRPNYIPVIELGEGWPWGFGANPDFESMAMKKAPEYIRAAMFWGGSDQIDYLVLNYGSWAWNPEKYHYSDTRQYIYEYVFGRERAHHAEMFEKTQKELLQMFDRSERPFILEYRLKDARKLARTMAKHLDWLRDNPYTMIPDERYNNKYIKGMENEVRIAYSYLSMEYMPGEYTEEKPAKEPYNIRWQESFVPEGFEPLVVDNAIEAENMAYNEERSEEVKYFPGTQFAWYDLSQNKFLYWNPEDGEGNKTIEFEFETDEKGLCHVEACFLKWNTFGVFDIYLDGEKIGSSIDLYTKNPYGTPKYTVQLKSVDIDKGMHTLRIANVNDERGSGFALDYLLLQPE